MMTPVGRLAIIRTFPKSELLVAMNFVIIPALIGPLLGPTVGGLIVHWLSWREIFFVNVPIGLAALVIIYRHMPNYLGDARGRFDIVGLVLFGSGTALLSWLLEIFGEHNIDVTSGGVLFLLSLSLLAAYAWHARQLDHPLISPFALQGAHVPGRSRRRLCHSAGHRRHAVSVAAALSARLALPAWESGLLMMPAAARRWAMKVLSAPILPAHGFRRILVANTVILGRSSACSRW